MASSSAAIRPASRDTRRSSRRMRSCAESDDLVDRSLRTPSSNVGRRDGVPSAALSRATTSRVSESDSPLETRQSRLPARTGRASASEITAMIAQRSASCCLDPNLPIAPDTTGLVIGASGLALYGRLGETSRPTARCSGLARALPSNGRLVRASRKRARSSSGGREPWS